MATKPTWEQIEQERDESLRLPLAPEVALRGLMAVDPDTGPANEPAESKSKSS